MKSFILALFVLAAIIMACGVSAQTGCEKPCFANYIPVCCGSVGSSANDATFGNECSFDVYNCEMSLGWVKKYDGECV